MIMTVPATTTTHTLATMLHQTSHRMLREVVDYGHSTNWNATPTSTMGEVDTANATMANENSNGNDGDSSSDGGPSFDPRVFWSVNAFILVLFVVAVLLCRFGKMEWFVYDGQEGRLSSDEQYRQSVIQRQQEQQQAKVETPAQRTRKLLRSFRRHDVEMTVKEEDFVDDAAAAAVRSGALSPVEEGIENDGSESDGDVADIELGRDDSMNDTGFLQLQNGTLVPNCCAICLMSYEVGDKVIWSSNPNCAHAFHEDCVVGWLVKMQPETPCPCCRQEFTDLEDVRKERKIKWGRSRTFNPNVISLSR